MSEESNVVESSGAASVETTSAADDAMPALNAGQDATSVYEPLSIDNLKEVNTETADKSVSDDTETADAAEDAAEDVEETEDTVEDAEPEEEQPASSGGDEDDDVLNVLLGKGDKTDDAQQPPDPNKIPDGISKEDWDAFQAFKQANNKDAPKPIDPATLEISDKEHDTAFSDADTFRSCLSKASTKATLAMKDQIYGELNHVLRDLDNIISERIETMIYLNEATKDNPEILQADNYKRAFTIAYNKARTKVTNGDLRAPIDEAVEIFKRELGRAEGIRKTKKVDVRPKTAPPKGGAPSNRQVHVKKQEESDSDPGGLSFLINQYKR